MTHFPSLSLMPSCNADCIRDTQSLMSSSNDDHIRDTHSYLSFTTTTGAHRPLDRPAWTTPTTTLIAISSQHPISVLVSNVQLFLPGADCTPAPAPGNTTTPTPLWLRQPIALVHPLPSWPLRCPPYYSQPFPTSLAYGGQGQRLTDQLALGGTKVRLS